MRRTKPSVAYITEKHQDLTESIQDVLGQLSSLTMPHDEDVIMRGYDTLTVDLKKLQDNAILLTSSLHGNGANAEAEQVKQQVLQFQRLIDGVREQYEIRTIGGSSARRSETSSVSRKSIVSSTPSQRKSKLKGSIASKVAERKFASQADEVELQRISLEKETEMERKRLEIRLKKLREDGQVAGMQAELSVLEEEEAGGDRSLLDTNNPLVGGPTLSPTIASQTQSQVKHGPDPRNENGGWSFPEPVYPPLYLGDLNENLGRGGWNVVGNSTSRGTGRPQTDSMPNQPAKSVGFVLPDDQVSQTGRNRGFVYKTLENIVRGGPLPGRTQEKSGTALSTGAISRNQPTQPPASSVLPWSPGARLGTTNGLSPLAATVALVTDTTTTTTQSGGTVPSLQNSSSQGRNTPSHGGSTGVRSSPMVTTCSATSHSSFSPPVYVPSPSGGFVLVPASNVAYVLKKTPVHTSLLFSLP